MDTERVREATERAFSRHIEDGTVDVYREGDQARLDGGNWEVIVTRDGSVATSMPTNDPNSYDDDPDTFLDNVLGTEVDESMALLDARLDGALVKGLLDSGESWSVRLGERLREVPLGR